MTQKNALSHLYFLISIHAPQLGISTATWFERRAGLNVSAGTEEQKAARIDQVHALAIQKGSPYLETLCFRYKNIPPGRLPVLIAWAPVRVQEPA